MKSLAMNKFELQRKQAILEESAKLFDSAAGRTQRSRKANYRDSERAMTVASYRTKAETLRAISTQLAMASDLLAALEAALAWHDEGKMMSTWEEAAREAIAKAKGKS